MAKATFRLDRAGVAQVLKSPEMRDMVNGLAVRVAGNARSSLPTDAPVDFRPYTTDRQGATVSIRHRRAMEWQERDGILTRAARSAGLEVRESSE